MTYGFYLVVIFTSLSYLEDLDRNGLRLVSSPPGCRKSSILSRYVLVSHDAGEDVRRWHDSMATTNLAKISQGSTLQFNIKLFIGVQDLGRRAIESETIDGVIEEGAYTRSDIGKLLSTL